MTAKEIIAALSTLPPQELALVDEKLHELMHSRTSKASAWQSLLEVAGTAQGLPADLAEQHDHYIHGIPKR